jgi:hypothetical protein
MLREPVVADNSILIHSEEREAMVASIRGQESGERGCHRTGGAPCTAIFIPDQSWGSAITHQVQGNLHHPRSQRTRAAGQTFEHHDARDLGKPRWARCR